MKLHLPLRKNAAHIQQIQAQAQTQAQMLEEQQMISYINSARSEMEWAASLCDELTDFTAIDYASYSLLAARTKYEYLMKLAKERGLSI